MQAVVGVRLCELQRQKMYILTSALNEDSDQSAHCMRGQNLNQAHFALRKHAYSNILKILPAKNEKFRIKHSYTRRF